jgi:hypothetical protein
MKKLILIIAFLCSFAVIKAQAPSNIVSGNWQSAVLRADGQTNVNGVESYCMKMSCNGEDYIVIKLKNTNNYQVKVEWTDAIFYNGVWNPANGVKKLVLPASSESAGDCSGEIKLRVSINSILNNLPAGSGHYSTMGLAVIQ